MLQTTVYKITELFPEMIWRNHPKESAQQCEVIKIYATFALRFFWLTHLQEQLCIGIGQNLWVNKRVCGEVIPNGMGRFSGGKIMSAEKKNEEILCK